MKSLSFLSFSDAESFELVRKKIFYLQFPGRKLNFLAILLKLYFQERRKSVFVYRVLSEEGFKLGSLRARDISPKVSKKVKEP